jgi:hypothetical protein
MVNTKKNSTKSWWKSKTLWLNTVMFILAGLNQLSELGISPEKVVMLIAAFNMILRFLTKEPIAPVPKE